MLEEEHAKELERFVGEWLPIAKETCVSRRPSRSRKVIGSTVNSTQIVNHMIITHFLHAFLSVYSLNLHDWSALFYYHQRSNDKRRVSKLLNEEADKIIEDFISSVEDNTDISSFDGDRSDTSSTFGTTFRPKDVLMHFGEPEHYRTPTRMGPLPVEMDGVVLPWLQWETNADSPLKNKKQTPATPKTVLQDTIEVSTSFSSLCMEMFLHSSETLFYFKMTCSQTYSLSIWRGKLLYSSLNHFFK